MARHAGFAVAASIGEPFINQTIRAAFEDLDPIHDSLLFTLPSSVPIGGGSTVELSGTALFEQQPKITLRPNPGNTASMRASALLYVAAAIDSPGGPSFDQTWKLRIAGDASVAMDAEVAPDGVFLRWLPAGSSLSAVSVTRLEGPSVPQWLIQALNSPPVLAAMNQALQSVGAVRVSGKLMSRTISHVQPMTISSVQLSLFEWFRIDETISRVDLRVLDGCVSVGIDFAGRTNGDAGQLVDLRDQVGDTVVYRWPVFDNTGNDRPVLIGSGAKQGVGDVAVLVNTDFISAIGASVSAQIAGTPVAPDVHIVSVGLRIEHFDKPMRGREIGLRFDFTVNHRIAGDFSGHLYLQTFLVQDGEPGPTPFPDSWRMYVGLVEFNVPWWVDFAVVLVGVAVSACLPIVAPLMLVGVVAAIEGIIPGVISNAESQASRSLGSGVTLASGARSSVLPTKKQQSSWENVNRIAFASDGVNAHMAIVAASLRFEEAAAAAAPATVMTQFYANAPEDFQAKVQLRGDLLPLASDCTAQLIVTRPDTQEEVARVEGPYSTHGKVTFSHLSEELYYVDAFHVQARIWLSRASMTGLLFVDDIDVQVSSSIDRRRPFLTWGWHWAHFRSPTAPEEWWHRLSNPKLHRTAASSLCLAVRQRISDFAAHNLPPSVEYRDELPFPWDELAAHRHELCDYCFFGGPTLTKPYPRKDWFS